MKCESVHVDVIMIKMPFIRYLRPSTSVIRSSPSITMHTQIGAPSGITNNCFVALNVCCTAPHIMPCTYYKVCLSSIKSGPKVRYMQELKQNKKNAVIRPYTLLRWWGTIRHHHHYHNKNNKNKNKMKK